MKVSLFVTCLTDTFYPRVGQAVVSVLEHLGADVDFPPQQTCCGQPLFNGGCHREAADLARKMIRDFEGSEYVVTPSGSCCAMVREHYPKLLENDRDYAQRARELAERTYEFAEFLLKVAKVDLAALGCRWPADGGGARLTYHYSCHLRGLGMRDETVHLLNQIAGVQVVPLDKAEQCCGFGGAFSVKFPEVSESLARDKVACIGESGADALVCNDGGCTLQIAGRLHRDGVALPTRHLAEIIAEGLGLVEAA
ncbi:MAG: (Fe-S)-binding protein [Phycisphaerae bacterium]|nr:(Fe-S)-binding protein [Phycisphaerae bacterium]